MHEINREVPSKTEEALILLFTATSDMFKCLTTKKLISYQVYMMLIIFLVFLGFLIMQIGWLPGPRTKKGKNIKLIDFK